MSINVLFVATAENRKYKINDLPSDLPDLLDGNGNISDDYSSELDNFKLDYFEIISSLCSGIIRYITIDPAYSEEKIHASDDQNYLGHISEFLEDIDLEKYQNTFDIILITSAYDNIFNINNINIISKLIKPNGYLITTHPNGLYNLNNCSNFKFIKSDNDKYIFKYN